MINHDDSYGFILLESEKYALVQKINNKSMQILKDSDQQLKKFINFKFQIKISNLKFLSLGNSITQ